MNDSGKAFKTTGQPIEKTWYGQERVFLLLVASIFLAEVIAMGIIHVINPVHGLIEALLDASIVIVLIVPVLYYLHFRPLLNHISERNRSEGLLRGVLENLPVGVWIVDQNGNVQHGNQASLKIWGGARYVGMEQYGEYKAWHLSNGQPVQAEEWAAARAIRDGQTILDQEVEIEGFDGQRKMIMNSAAPIWENGTIQGAIVVNQDITQRKQAEIQLEQQNKELNELSLAEAKQRQLAEGLVQSMLSLNASLELQEVLDRILVQIHLSIPYEMANIILVEQDSLTLVHLHDPQDDLLLIDEIGHTYLLHDYPVIQEMCQTRQPVLVAELPAAAGLAIPGLPQPHCYLAAPLIVGERVIGIINLISNQPGSFNQETAQRLTAFATPAALAVQNAWLFEQVRAGHERQQSLSRHLVEVQEKERSEIARELHDEASQSLTALMFGLSLLEQEAHNPETILVKLGELKRLTDQVMEGLHRLAMGLRPASLDYLGLAEALEQLAKDMDERYNLRVHFKLVGSAGETTLPEYVETNIYRIVQEALTNVVRHASAKNVDVILEKLAEKTIVIIEDDGIGFDASSSPKTGHVGLLGMQERAQMIAGELHIESSPGCGTTIILEVSNVDSHPDRR